MVTLNGFFANYEPNNAYELLILVGDRKARYLHVDDALEVYGNCPIYFWHVVNNRFVIAIKNK